MTRSESEGLKCLNEHASLGKRVRGTDGVQSLERLDRLKHFTSRVLALLFRNGKILHAYTLQDSNLSIQIEHVKFRCASIILSSNHHVRRSCGAQRESSRLQHALNFTLYWRMNALPTTVDDVLQRQSRSTWKKKTSHLTCSSQDPSR